MEFPNGESSNGFPHGFTPGGVPQWSNASRVPIFDPPIGVPQGTSTRRFPQEGPQKGVLQWYFPHDVPLKLPLQIFSLKVFPQG